MTSLRLRMMEDMQVRNLSRHTQDSYLLQVSQFARHFAKSPALLGPEDIHAYQVYLTNEKQLAPRSVQVTVAALRFLYRVTLGLDWDFDRIIPCPKAPKTLAVIPRDFSASVITVSWATATASKSSPAAANCSECSSPLRR